MNLSSFQGKNIFQALFKIVWTLYVSGQVSILFLMRKSYLFELTSINPFEGFHENQQDHWTAFLWTLLFFWIIIKILLMTLRARIVSSQNQILNTIMVPRFQKFVSYSANVGHNHFSLEHWIDKQCNNVDVNTFRKTLEDV